MRILALKWFVFILCIFLLYPKIPLAQYELAQKNKDDPGQPPSIAKALEDYQIYERTGIHNGNLVNTLFSNYGNLGSRDYRPSFEWPKGSGNEYSTVEFCAIVGAELTDVKGNRIHILSERYSGGTADRSDDNTHWFGWVPLPGYYNDGGISTLGIPEDLNGNGLLDIGEDVNNNEVLDTQLTNTRNQIAMSDYLPSWPSFWPNRDDAWKGKWNGEYGSYARADQESYYIIDDRYNDEFQYYPYIGSGIDSSGYPHGRRGLGVEAEVRSYQWSHPMAEDILISIYDIRNVSDKPLQKVTFGMYTDADLGGTGDVNDDLASFDTHDDITYQWDLDGLSNIGKKMGYFGFAFLESPGNPDNGIDDDEDGMVDESQTDGVDNDHDWQPFDDLNSNGIWDSEDKNNNGVLDSGEDSNENRVMDFEPLNDDVGTDGIGPDSPEYVGADSDGTQGNSRADLGEPNFEYTDNHESDQIGLTSWHAHGPGGSANDEAWWQRLIPDPVGGSPFSNPDYGPADVVYTYGSGYIALPITKRMTETVGRVTKWQIPKNWPDHFRRFSIACLFGNDFDDILRNKRTMQTIYDHDYNFTKPPLKPKLVARPGNQKVFLYWDTRSERSSDPVYGKDFEGYKLYRATDPQFNEIKTVTDIFGNPLLWKPIAQWDLKDGLKGTHPLAFGETGLHYYMGDDTGLKHYYIDEDVENGRTYYYSLCAYDMGYSKKFHEMGLPVKPPNSVFEISPSENTKIITVNVQGEVTAVDINTASVVPNAPSAGFSDAQAQKGIEHVSGTATGTIKLEIAEPGAVLDGHRYRIRFTDTGAFSVTDSIQIKDVTANKVLFQSGNLNIPSFGDSVLAKIEALFFDGFKLDIANDYLPDVLDSYWEKGGKSNFQISIQPPFEGETYIKSARFPFDFEIRFDGPISDTSWSASAKNRIPTDFQIWDITNNRAFDFYFDADRMMQLDSAVVDSSFNPGDRIVLILNASKRTYEFESWQIIVKAPVGLEKYNWIAPKKGDVYRVIISRPFRHEDVYEFTMLQPRTDHVVAKNTLPQIHVVPDPYVVTASWERPLLFGSGRGERRVDFVNLPEKCTIKIFTSSGRLVRILEHHGLSDNGSEHWDLLSKDGMTVSYGVYLYHVDAPGIGNKVGKFAVIK